MIRFPLPAFLLLAPLASAADPVKIPSSDEVSCILKVRRAVNGEDVERVQLHCHADGSGAVVTYSLSGPGGTSLKHGARELKGNPLDQVEKTFEDLFKSAELRVSEVTVLKETPAEKIEIEVERPGIGIWQTSFVPARAEAWKKAAEFFKKVSRIAP